MKRTIFLFLLCLNYSLRAQDALILDKANDNIIRPVQLVDLVKNQAGNYDAIVMSQFAGYTLNTTGIIVHGSETHYVNELRKLTYTVDGNLTASASVYYSKDGGPIKTGDIANTSQLSTESFADIKTKHPEIFKDDRFFSMLPGISSVDVIEWERDLFTLAYDKKDQRTVRIQHPDQEAEKKIITYSQTFQMDPLNGFITTYYGRKDIVNDENKWNEMKDFDFVTYNDAGSVVNRFNVKFPFPRQLNQYFDVFSEEDPSIIIGKVFIFQRAMLFGKKYNDPEKNNFDIVYCTNDGKLILHKTSKMGTIEKPYINFDAAYGNGNSINIFINANIEDVPKAGIIQLSADGTETASLLTNQDIKSITTVVQDPKPMPVIENRSILGFGNENPGYKWSLSADYIVHGMARAANGDLFIYGQMRYEVDDPNPATPQPGASTMTMAPKLKKYSEFICIQIGPDNTTKKFYVSLLPVSGEMGTFTALTDASGKMILTIPVPLLKAGDAFIQSGTFYTLGGKGLSTYNKTFHYLPKLCVIDPVTTQAKSVGYAEDYYLFNLEKSFMVDSQNSKVVIGGFSRDPKEDKLFVLRAVAY
jgi:hypothetical protein